MVLGTFWGHVTIMPDDGLVTYSFEFQYISGKYNNNSFETLVLIETVTVHNTKLSSSF